MTSSPDFSSFLSYYNSDAGRKVYIDPELILPFAEYVKPATDSGNLIASEIMQRLSSVADGKDAGQAEGKPDLYYMDFGKVTGHCVRLFYKIFQDDAGGLSRGPGVYIYNLRGFAHNPNNVGAGLFHMRYTDGSWEGTKASGREIKNKIFRIGSAQDANGLLSLQELSKEMLVAADQATYKTDFDLYHSPLAVIVGDQKYTSPEGRGKIANPQELADILVGTATANEWGGQLYDKYTVYVYDESAKLLTDALGLVKGSNQVLKKFEFRLLAPHAPFSVVEKLANGFGASAVLDKNVITPFSSSYQMLDSESYDDSNSKVYAKFQQQIQNKANISFFEVWRSMKTDTNFLS